MKRLSILLCGLVFVLGFGAVSASRSQIPITNNGFESGDFTGWVAGNGWKVVSGNAAEGNYSAQVTLSGGSNPFGQSSVLCTKPYPATSGDAHFLLSWKASASKNGYADFMVRFFDSGKQRMYDSGYTLTDDFKFRRNWGQGGQVVQYEGGSYYAFCVQAVAYQGRTYTVNVDSVSLSQ